MAPSADLPDPNEAMSASQAGGADDLLAQLAGDEIDRLLAESETKEAAEPSAIADDATAMDPQEFVEQAAVEAAEETASVVMDSPLSGDDTVASQLDALFEELNNPAAPVAKAPGLEAVAENDAPSPEQEAELLAPPRELELDVDVPLPMVLRPLVWINIPFAMIPDGVRDFMGKAAIVTLVNAMILLAYTHFVRKH